MTTLEQLLTQLEHCPSIRAIPANTLYATSSEQIIFDIKTTEFSARIAAQGAQPLEYSRGNNNILWLSPHAIFDNKAAICGGIPICLPWFGTNRHDPNQTEHGFARNQSWQLVNATETPDEIALTFGLTHKANQHYPYSFSCDITWRFNLHLQATLNVRNESTVTMPLSFALHSYFRVNNKYETTVTGLGQHSFLDNTQNLQRCSEQGDIHFETEVDRVYENCEWPLIIDAAQTRVQLDSQRMPTAIVWNPDQRGIASRDIQAGYINFVCVERGAAFADEVQLAPKRVYHCNMEISTEKEFFR